MTESIQCNGLPSRLRNSLHCLSCTSLASGSGSASEMYESVKPFGRGSAAGTPQGWVLLKETCPSSETFPRSLLCHGGHMATAPKTGEGLKVVLLAKNLKSCSSWLSPTALALLVILDLPRIVLSLATCFQVGFL